MHTLLVVCIAYELELLYYSYSSSRVCMRITLD